jgi:hypothetical protein
MTFSTVSFTGLDIDLDDAWWAGYGLLGMKKSRVGPQNGPTDDTWARTQFDVTEVHGSVPKTSEWILRELTPNFTIYSFQNANTTTRRYTIVVRFKELNDAIMFKLRDGHRAWEIS